MVIVRTSESASINVQDVIEEYRGVSGSVGRCCPLGVELPELLIQRLAQEDIAGDDIFA
jgi:hypothetical protein